MNVTAYLKKIKKAIAEANTREWIESVDKKFNISQIVSEIKKSKITQATCLGCKTLVALAKKLISMGKSDQSIVKTATNICELLGSYFEAKDSAVCQGLMGSMGVMITFDSNNQNFSVLTFPIN